MNFKDKKNEVINNKQNESYENPKKCYICKEMFEDKHAKDKNYLNVRDHCHYIDEYRSAAHSICILKYNVPKETPIVFHNKSGHDYHERVSRRI